MNIKSLLIGSAAAFVAVNSGQAADAIVSAEPEPLQYVRICDSYGSGYFYIPGTETCLKIGGRVRTEGEWYDAYNPNSRVGTLWHTRTELGLDTATDTEYGPLKTNTVLRFEMTESTSSQKVLWANISLGGFLVGKLDSQYNLYTGYAGNVINDDVIYDGPKELNQLTYTYNPGNGFTALVSLEDNNSADDNFGYRGAWHNGKADQYAPDVVAGFGYKAGPISVKFIGGYDAIVKEGAIKARVDATFTDFSLFIMGGYNSDGDKLNRYAGSYLNSSSCPVGRGDLCGWGDWAAWGGATIPFNSKVTANLQVAYTDSKIFAATANVQLRPVKDFVVTPEVSYTNFDSIDQDQWAGVLRFERKF